jgi:hypothetical protein
MPQSRYFKGRGRKVMRSMRGRYGAKRGKNIFYATVNKWRTRGTKRQKAAQPKRAPGARRRRR